MTAEGEVTRRRPRATTRSTRRQGDRYLCTRCRQLKPAADFTKDRRRAHGLALHCRPCRKLDHAERPEAEKGRSLRRLYDLSREEYDRLFEDQGGVCAICRQPETRLHRGRVRMLSVDHDHTTGRVRGLLCRNCNSAIGLLGDDPDLLRSALAYLEGRS